MKTNLRTSGVGLVYNKSIYMGTSVILTNIDDEHMIVKLYTFNKEKDKNIKKDAIIKFEGDIFDVKDGKICIYVDNIQHIEDKKLKRKLMDIRNELMYSSQI